MDTGMEMSMEEIASLVASMTTCICAGASSRSVTYQAMAPAKVNLHLGVSTQCTPDGRHQLETVFHTVDLADLLVFTFSEEGDQGSCAAPRETEHQATEPQASGSQLDLTVNWTGEPGLEPMHIDQEDNLVVKALRALAARCQRPLPATRIRLKKKIPAQSGLGGGSSDAAAALLALARFWYLDPLGPECLEVAGSLGSDIAFFLHGGCALMSGDGSTLERALPALEGCPIVLVKPTGGVSTKTCYQAFDENPPAAEGTDALVQALADQDAAAVGQNLANNLEPAACSLLPSLAETLDWLAAQPGVLGSQLTGSGSAAFALFTSTEAADAVAEEAQEQGLWSYSGFLDSRGASLL